MATMDLRKLSSHHEPTLSSPPVPSTEPTDASDLVGGPPAIIDYYGSSCLSGPHSYLPAVLGQDAFVGESITNPIIPYYRTRANDSGGFDSIFENLPLSVFEDLPRHATDSACDDPDEAYELIYVKNASSKTFIGCLDEATGRWYRILDLETESGAHKRAIHRPLAAHPNPPNNWYQEAIAWKRLLRAIRGVRVDVEPPAEVGAFLETWSDDEKMDNVFRQMLNEMQGGCAFIPIKLPSRLHCHIICANPYCPVPKRRIRGTMDCVTLQFVDDGGVVFELPPVRGVPHGMLRLYVRAAHDVKSTIEHVLRFTRMWFCMWCFLAIRFSPHQAALICRMNRFTRSDFHAAAARINDEDLFHAAILHEETSVIECRCEACTGVRHLPPAADASPFPIRDQDFLESMFDEETTALISAEVPFSEECEQARLGQRASGLDVV